mmetsp:Transcript_54151/g.104681  ORF Transcript_54151/g.104681 Transcript_54151/m.104681 type:complete len:237 (+) Transcript_54151:129-839(+)
MELQPTHSELVVHISGRCSDEFENTSAAVVIRQRPTANIKNSIRAAGWHNHKTRGAATETLVKTKQTAHMRQAGGELTRPEHETRGVFPRPEDMLLAFCRRWKWLAQSDLSKLAKLAVRWMSLGRAGYSLAGRPVQGPEEQLDMQRKFKVRGVTTGDCSPSLGTVLAGLAAGLAARRVLGLVMGEVGEGPGNAQRESEFFSFFSPPGPRSPLGPPCARPASRLCPHLDPSTPTSPC